MQRRRVTGAGIRLFAAALLVGAVACGSVEDGDMGAGGSIGAGGFPGAGGAGGQDGSGGSGGLPGAGGGGGVGGAGGAGGAPDNPGDLCDAPLTWEAFGEPFVGAVCQTCHSESVVGWMRQGAPIGVNFDTEDDVRRHGDRMVQRVMRGEMPPTGPVRDCEAERFAQYVETL